MKLNTFVVSMLITLSFVSHSQAIQKNQKRLLQDKKSKQCFFMESVKKSEKYGWLNETKAKQISQIKRKRIMTASSPIDVRKVYVPKDWCQGS